MKNMAVALILCIFISLLGLISAWVLGYGTILGVSLVTHIKFAFPTSLIVLFTHTMTLFYFIGTGKSIKTAVTEYKLDQNFLVQTTALKKKLFPLILLAILLMMITFILGGGTDAKVVADWVHGLFGGATLVCSILAFVREYQAIFATVKLMNAVGEKLIGNEVIKKASSLDEVSRSTQKNP